MSTRINTNVLAMNAARYSSMNSTNVSSSIEKLSSGLRINRAADDAAGLVISESLRAQISGVDQAIRNSSEGTNLVKTAEGALNEVHAQLRKMRELANHAANTAVNDATALAADQAQISNAVASLNRIAANTSYGNVKLLDGSAAIKVSANTTDLTGGVASGSTVKGSYGINVTTAGVKGSASASQALFYGKATAAGAATVSAAAALSAGVFIRFSDASSGLGISDTVVVDIANSTSLQEVANKINNDATASKYVSASINSSGVLVFDSKAAVSTDYASQFTYTISTSAAASAIGFTAAVTGTGTATVATTSQKIMVDTQYTFQKMDRAGNLTDRFTFAIAKGSTLKDVFNNFDAFAKANGLESSLTLTSTGAVRVVNNDVGTNRGVSVTTGGNDILKIAGTASTNGTNMTGSVNGIAIAAGDIDGSKVSLSAASGVSLKDAYGLSFTVATAITSGSKGSVTVDGGSLKFQLGANAGEQAEVSIESIASDQIGQDVIAGKSIANLDVTTAQGAQDALKIIDKAISDISKRRADLGAFQSQVLESNIRSLGIAKENLSASESTIRDTDMAAEMVMFTKNNILSQASQAMLSQANNASQGILQLLRG